MTGSYTQTRPMRRLAPILTSILIGALAVALGMGIYLKKANADRERLAQTAMDAERLVKEAQDQQAQAVLEANRKVEAASAEVAKAQLALKSLQEERDLMALATPLDPPRPSQIRGWKEAVNLPLGASMKYPPTAQIEMNDKTALTLSRVTLDGDLQPSEDARWFSLTPWTDADEQELVSHFTTSTPASYLINGHLLIGRSGVFDNSTGSVFVFKVRAGSMLFLIWARDLDMIGEHTTLLRALSTLDFKS